MKNPLFSFLLLFILLLGCNLVVSEDSDNLLKNPDFEKGSGELPSSWSKNVWTEYNGSVTISVAKEAYAGEQGVLIKAEKPADAKVVQTVKVEPGKIYKISGYIKASGISKENVGANLSVLSVTSYSKQVFDTGGKWVYVDLYGRTGKDQKSIDVAVRIGGYSSVNSGTAWFDQISVQKVNKAPAGTGIVEFYSEPMPETTASDTEEGEGRKTVSIETVWLFSILYLIFFALLYLYGVRRPPLEQNSLNIMILLGLSLLAGLLLRYIIAPSIEGYQNDISCFRAWSDRSSSLPYSQFYAEDYFCDYPPGYIYILSFLGHIRRFFGLSTYSPVFLAILKSPAIICDIVTSLLIFVVARKKIKESVALTLSVLYTFNPGVILTSAVWGQVDSVAALLVFLILICVVKNKLWQASLLMGAAALIKLQTGFVFFVIIFALIRRLVRYRDWKSVGLSAVCGFGSFILLVLPFNWGKGPTWIIELIGGTLGGYKYATINAFNLFTLFKGNWAPVTNNMLFMPFSTWGSLFTVILLLFIFILYFVAKDDSRNFTVSLVFISGLFMTMVVMHERYLFPALMLSLLTYTYTQDERFLYVFAGFSITYFVNSGHVLDVLIGYPHKFVSIPISYTVAALNVCIFLYLLFLCINNYIKQHVFRDMFKY